MQDQFEVEIAKQAQKREQLASNFTEDERKRISLALIRAAVAVAELWDIQKEVEERKGVEVNSTFDLIASLAGETSCGDPQVTDISLDNAWTAYLADVKVTK